MITDHRKRGRVWVKSEWVSEREWQLKRYTKNVSVCARENQRDRDSEIERERGEREKKKEREIEREGGARERKWERERERGLRERGGSTHALFMIFFLYLADSHALQRGRK